MDSASIMTTVSFCQRLRDGRYAVLSDWVAPLTLNSGTTKQVKYNKQIAQLNLFSYHIVLSC